MKKLLIFTSHYYPHIGGIERFTENFAYHIKKKGIKVTILTNNTNESLEYEVLNDIEIIRIDSINLLNGRFPIPKINYKLFKIIKKLKEDKFNFCLIQARFYILSLIAAIFCKKNSIDFVVLEHGTGHFTVSNIFFDFIGHIYEHIISYILKLFSRKFAGVSKNCCLWLSHFGINTTEIIYNGIDISKFTQHTIKMNHFKNTVENPIIISYISRLIAEKGIIKLINVFKELRKKYDNIYLIIAGYGDLYEYIENEASLDENMLFLGKVEANEAYNIFNSSDIFVYPSEYPEGFPTVILEAAFFKNYIIASDKGGTSELIINRDYGVLLKDNTELEIYNELDYVINNKNIIYNVSNNVSDYVRNKFSWDIITNNFINQYLNH